MLNAEDLEMFQTEGDDSSSGRLLSLLLASLKRSSSAEKEKAMLYQKLIALSNVIEHQKQQIQVVKVVV